MQSMKHLMLILTVLVSGFIFASSPAVAASKPSSIVGKACDALPAMSGCDADGQKLDSNGDPDGLTYFQVFLNIFLFAAGIVSFIFVIMGGVRYITSTGDPTRIESAKNTLLYAIIGLIVTFLAVPISAFIIHAAGG